VTVLDASVVIALLDSTDAHHDAARQAVRATVAAGQPLQCSPITLAEILVRPARRGRLPETEHALKQLGIETLHLSTDAASRLALLRAETGMKLPDCCVLLAALQSAAQLITFDDALAKAATRLGLTGPQA